MTEPANPNSKLMRHREQKRADFLLVRSEITAKGVAWTGYWLHPETHKSLHIHPEMILIHQLSDWVEIPYTRH